ncbi:hypothetical protein OQA88_1327 [Cercophora sp. LCS_1]
MASEIVAGESRASQVQAACIAFFVISPIFVALRVWGRVKVRSWSGLSWDDGTLLVAWIFSIIMSALFMVASTNGLGQHITELADVSRMLQSLYVADVFYKLSLNITKMSVLFLYLRRFTTPWFTRACWVMLGFMAAFTVATTITTIAQCTPITDIWGVTTGGTCIDSKAYWYANSAITIVTDVVLLALPFQPIHSSGLPGGQKVALILVFAIGMFTTITSILRMQTINGLTLGDPTWDIDPTIWTIIEANLALICGCIPVYRPLLAPIFPAQFSRSTIKPADNRRQTLAPTRSEVSLANRPRKTGINGSKAGGSEADLEKGFDDLPLPPFIKDPNGPPKRSSVIRDAYVWMTGVM